MHGHKGALWSRVEISSRSWKKLNPGGGGGPEVIFLTRTSRTLSVPRSCTNPGNRCANRCTGWFDVIASRRERIRLPQHAYILPPSSRLGAFFYFISPYALSWALVRAVRPRGHSRRSLFLASFAPSSIKICFAGRKYFASCGMFRLGSPDIFWPLDDLSHF